MGASSVTGVDGPGAVATPTTQGLAKFFYAINQSAFLLKSEFPTGLINSNNMDYHLSVVPLMLLLFKNGLLQTPTLDFMIEGNKLTFTAGSTPMVGDVVYAFIVYRG